MLLRVEQNRAKGRLNLGKFAQSFKLPFHRSERAHFLKVPLLGGGEKSPVLGAFSALTFAQQDSDQKRAVVLVGDSHHVRTLLVLV